MLQDCTAAVGARSVGPPDASARAATLLADAVQRQAYVLAYIDGFMVIGYAVIGVLLMLLFLRAAPPQPTSATPAPAAMVTSR
jgi:DHA2 family multidrug resistance protein